MKKILIFSVYTLFVEGLFASSTCVEFFALNSQNENRDGTADFLAYLANLFEQQIIGEPELQRIVAGLEAGNLVNPITQEKGMVNSASLLHREEVQEYLDSTNLNQAKLLRWAKENLKRMQYVHTRRHTTRVDTDDISHEMKFYPIPRGTFKKGDEDEETAHIFRDFEMMSTLVTQKHWVELMGDNPSRFSIGSNTKVMWVNGRAVRLQPDHPVENLTWWSAAVFANKLSEKHGLKPVYDLSDVSPEYDVRQVSFDEQAAMGILAHRGSTLQLHAVVRDLHLAEGFRLPTEIEQEYVRKNLGQGQFYPWSSLKDLRDHAWVIENSFERTQAVGQFKPLLISGNDFYDLFGNVWEWAGDVDCKRRLARGGAYNCKGLLCRPAIHYALDLNTRAETIGFRLVRTLPK